MKYAPINKCIYCGSIEGPLTDEHIIPEALSGTDVLPSASCRVCQKKTSKAENALGVSVLPLLKLLSTRSKKKRSSLVRLKGLDQNGKSYSEDKNPQEIGLLAVFPNSREPPGFLTGQPLSDEVGFEIINLFNPGQLGPFQSPGSRLNAKPINFARMVAKIAHAQAIANLGLDAFEPFLLELIREEEENWWHWVGSCPEIPDPISGAPLVSVQLHNLLEPHKNILLGRVRICESIGGPIYDVAVGRLLTN